MIRLVTATGVGKTVQLGSIVEYLDRLWVVTPSDDPQVARIRPLSGTEDLGTTAIFLPLLKRGLETFTPGRFPYPSATAQGDRSQGELLLQATKLILRSGAGPFRCFGNLGGQPRPYQIVPLLMALRLETVRLLIADDVGIGKTIEAGLIARELLDRREVKRIGVLCPPHLCEQWQKELAEKFNIPATVIRSGTASKLEREATGQHIFQYFRHIIVSLDYAKSERRLESFIVHCPDLVIVDEAHTCALPNALSGNQQQRYNLIRRVAEKRSRHLILLTATPHSGIQASFQSLLELLQPEFGRYNLECLGENERRKLAKHFIQRRRADVKRWLGNDTPFPERVSYERPYQLSKEYASLFADAFSTARSLVKSISDEMSYAQKRGRYWSALSLIRCVMSSPRAAMASLSKKLDLTAEECLEDILSSYVYDPTDREHNQDDQLPVFSDYQQQKLRGLLQRVSNITPQQDKKLQECIKIVEEVLDRGQNPIIWCRYIATAEYVAEHLRHRLQKREGVNVVAITGKQAEDEREIKLAELVRSPKPILVATDCLSEGVNLQQHFAAVIHYDLPWNPNRLEQREGRVDRYGQPSGVVACYLLYGTNNPVDGAVLSVLVRKAIQIHKSLGITVPVPVDSASVAEAIFQALFEHSAPLQLSLWEENNFVSSFHQEWERATDRERISRTRFAQHSIHPEEVAQELREAAGILGTDEEVKRFVCSALSRLHANLILTTIGNVPCWRMPIVPECLRPLLGESDPILCFSQPNPPGTEYVGRTHPIVANLAQFLLEKAIANDPSSPAARCGLTVTNAVEKRTNLFLLRIRYLLNQTLAEECVVVGFEGTVDAPEWLEETAAELLLRSAQPTADRPVNIRKFEISKLIDQLDRLHAYFDQIAWQRAQKLKSDHDRVRFITRERQTIVEPQLPVDVVGVYIFLPG